MRVTEIRELSVPLEGNIANAVVSFAEHTISMVAVALRDWRRSSRPTDAPGFGLEEKDGLREVISRLMA